MFAVLAIRLSYSIYPMQPPDLDTPPFDSTAQDADPAAMAAEPSGQLPAALAESVLPPSERNGHASIADVSPPPAPEVRRLRERTFVSYAASRAVSLGLSIPALRNICSRWRRHGRQLMPGQRSPVS